jgi:hypothetical protein
MWRVTVGEFGQVAQSECLCLREQRFEESSPCLSLRLDRAAADADPALDKRTSKPGPNRSLVIRSVALPHASDTSTVKVGVVR